MRVKIEHEISEQMIADLMATAVEGGSAYWCSDILLISDTKTVSEPWYADPEIYKQGLLVIKVVEIEPSKAKHDGIYYIDIVKMKKAFEKMSEFGTPKGFHLRNLLEENWDAETADVFLQLATFGEVVYG